MIQQNFIHLTISHFSREQKSVGEKTPPHHRVTFNEAREVACEDGDGTFTVTYSGLGERVREPDKRGTSKTPGLRVMFGQTSELETVELPRAHFSPYREVYQDEAIAR